MARPYKHRTWLRCLELERRDVPSRPLPFPVIYVGAETGSPPVVKAYDAETGKLNFERTVFDASFTVADTTPHSIAVAPTSSHLAAIPLDGATLSGRRFIFLASADDPIAGLRRVVFQLDGKTLGTDSSAPYDAVRGGRRVTPGLDTRRLRNGTHRLRVIVELRGGGRIVYLANFRVNN